MKKYFTLGQLVVYFTLLLASNLDAIFLKEIDVKENSPHGLKVADIKQLLVDQQKFTREHADDIKFHSANKNEDVPFMVYESGIIQLDGLLDRETICHRKNVINRCKERDNCCKVINIQTNQMQQSGEPLSYLIRVHILDENDEKPQFPPINTPYREIKEDSAVGRSFPLPQAIDLDAKKNSIKTYQITQILTGDDETFQLVMKNENKPYLELKKPLDREEFEYYRFTLKCEDGGNPPKMGSINIEIKILDVNDHIPVFDKKVYSASVPEGDTSKVLFEFIISDADAGENGHVTVKIEAPSSGYKSEFNPQAYFKINPMSQDGKHGQVKPSNHLDYEALHQSGRIPIIFNLVATDSGKPQRSSTAKVEITVTNVNDVAPEISFMKGGKDLNSRLIISESIAPGSWIAEMQVRDQDSKMEAIDCQIKNNGDTKFRLQPSQSNSYGLAYKRYGFKTVEHFDRERDESFSLEIECRDGDPQSERTSQANLMVIISDINDNSPQFEKELYVGEIREDSELGSPIRLLDRIICTDKDNGNNSTFSYSLEPDANFKDDVSQFTVEKSGSNKGDIRIRTKLDFEKKKVYQFLLMARDHGEPNQLSSTTTIRVNVLDINDNQPQFTVSHYMFSVSEGAKIGTEIGQVQATDLDTNPNNREVSYILQGERESLSLVRIDERTGVLRTSQLLDREYKDSISLTVVAKNPSQLANHLAMYPVEASILITVENLNDNKPEFKPAGRGKTYMDFFLEDIAQHQPDCKPLPYTVSDRDHDAATGECCDLSLKNNFSGMFSLLPPLNSMLCVKMKPPQPESFQITLIATDKNGNNSHKSEITFSVIIKSDPSRSKGPMGRDQRGNLDHRNSKQFVIVIILAVIVGIFCLILVCAIVVLKKCHLLSPRSNGKDKTTIQILGPHSPSQRGTLRDEKSLNEAHTLLRNQKGNYDPSMFHSEMGESDHLFNGLPLTDSENNTYESRLTYNRTRSKSCDSMDKPGWRSQHPDSFQMHKPMQHKSPSSLVDACRFPSSSIMTPNQQHYQTVKQPFSHSSNRPDINTVDNPVTESTGSFYQVIEPYQFNTVSNYNTIHPSNTSIYAGNSNFNQDRYASTIYAKETDIRPCRTSESDKSEDNIYEPKKSLKNAYFQTSFV